MEKTIWRKDGMKQIINTGHKEFDRQFVCASTGNVIGGGQYSNYIRPYTETECNGFINPPGHLQEFDLKHFDNLYYDIREYVKKYTHDKSAILYEFYHWNGERRIVHGFVLTTGYDDGYKLINYWTVGPTYKSYMVLEGVIPYITNGVKVKRQ
jgi:hypothetical protein